MQSVVKNQPLLLVCPSALAGNSEERQEPRNPRYKEEDIELQVATRRAQKLSAPVP